MLLVSGWVSDQKPLSQIQRSTLSRFQQTSNSQSFGGFGIRGADVVEFLKQLLAEIRGYLLVIWDGAPIHRCRAVKEYLAQGASRRLRLEQLPGYAPELNPDEGVWRYLKRVELKNVVCADLGQLRREFRAAVERLLTKPGILRSCIREVGYV